MAKRFKELSLDEAMDLGRLEEIFNGATRDAIPIFRECLQIARAGNLNHIPPADRASALATISMAAIALAIIPMSGLCVRFEKAAS